MKSFCKARGDGFGTCDGRSDNDTIRAQRQSPSYFIRVRNVPFDYYGNVKFPGKKIHEFPVHTPELGCLWSKPVHRGRDGISTGLLGSERLFERGNISEHGLSYFCMNPTNEFPPRLRRRRPACSAVQRDDIGSRCGDRLCRGEIGRDRNHLADSALFNTNDRHLNLLPECCDACSAVPPKTASPSAHDGDSDAGQRVDAVERITRRSLAGNDQRSTKRCWKHGEWETAANRIPRIRHMPVGDHGRSMTNTTTSRRCEARDVC